MVGCRLGNQKRILYAALARLPFDFLLIDRLCDAFVETPSEENRCDSSNYEPGFAA
jgi:hypothetical protein